MMNVIYYYYYLFYKKVLRDVEPHMLTILVLSFTEMLYVSSVTELLFTMNNIPYHTFTYYLILVTFIVFNYLYFIKTGRSKEIVLNQSKIKGNNILSGVFVFLFFVVGVALSMKSTFIIANMEIGKQEKNIIDGR